jgi:hypothetical protein
MFEQMCKRFCVGQVIDSNDLNIAALKRYLKSIPADSPEAINCHPCFHAFIPMFLLF